MRTEYEQSVYESARDSALAEMDQPKPVIRPYEVKADGWEFTFEASECGDGVYLHVRHGAMSGCALLSSEEIGKLCYAAGEAELEIPR